MPYDPAYPNDRLRQLYVRTNLQLTAFRAAIDRECVRRGERLASPRIAADAASLLHDVRRLMAREPGWNGRLLAEPAPTWSALAVKLALADRALAWFDQIYMSPADDEDEDDDD